MKSFLNEFIQRKDKFDSLAQTDTLSVPIIKR
jgi:hypothetical protein